MALSTLELRIGAHVYPIVFEEVIKDPDKKGETLQGMCKEDKIIKIAKSYSEDSQKATLMHEIVHALGYYLGDNVFIKDEQKITGFANLLYDVFVANPEIVKYLFS